MMKTNTSAAAASFRTVSSVMQGTAPDRRLGLLYFCKEEIMKVCDAVSAPEEVTAR